MFKKILTLTIMLSGFCSYANASDYYIQLNYGQNKIDTGVTSVTGATLDEEDAGLYIAGGTEVSDDFDLEVFYYDFGEASLTGDSGDTFTLDGIDYVFTSSGSISVTGSSIGVAGKLYTSLNEDIDLYGKLGFHSWETTVKVSSTTSSTDATDDGIDPIYGFGAEFNVAQGTDLVAGYEISKFDDDDVSYLFAGMKFTLGAHDAEH